MTNSVMGFVTGGNKTVQAAINIATSLKDTRSVFALAGEGVKILGRQLLALMANPIVAFLGLVSAAIMVLVRGIQLSEENLRKWEALMPPIRRGLAVLENEIQQLAGVLIDFMQAVSDTAGVFLTLAGTIPGAAPALDFLGQAVKRFVAGPVYILIDGLQKANEMYKRFIAWAAKAGKNLPALGGALEEVNRRNQEAIELANEKHDIFEQESKDIKANAAAEEEVQRLRQQAKNKELYTAQQRMEFIKRANELEEEQAVRNVDLAERKLKAAKAEAEWAGNTAATNRELAELEADVSRARMAYFLKTNEIKEQERTINRELAAEEKQQLSERKKVNDEAARSAQERIDKEREAIRQSLTSC